VALLGCSRSKATCKCLPLYPLCQFLQGSLTASLCNRRGNMIAVANVGNEHVETSLCHLLRGWCGIDGLVVVGLHRLVDLTDSRPGKSPSGAIDGTGQGSRLGGSRYRGDWRPRRVPGSART